MPSNRRARGFFARDVALVAEELLGAHLSCGAVTLAITEVEAYGLTDSASHTRFGRTTRNEPMWGPPGHLYVYLCYGIHNMVNIVAEAEGRGAAVLIRAAEPVAGLDLIRARRGDKTGPVLLTGPGKVGAALGIDTSWSGHDLCEAGGVELSEGTVPEEVLVGPRVGIDYAEVCDRVAPMRFAVSGTPWVSHRRTLALRTPG